MEKKSKGTVLWKETSLRDQEGVQWLLTGAAVGRTSLREKYQGKIASASEPQRASGVAEGRTAAGDTATGTSDDQHRMEHSVLRGRN